jgi:hypothetical protein
MPSDYFIISYGTNLEFVDTFQSVWTSNPLTITLLPDGSSGDSTTDHIATYSDAYGTLSQDPATAISGGNIQAGLSGTAGYLASFPSTAAKGSLRFKAIDNTGNTVTTVSNEAMAQASVISIPDPGQVTSKFLLTDNAGTQTIATGSLALTLGNVTATAGNLVAGSSGHAGTVSSFPATASKGSLKLVAVANTGDTLTTISNAAMGQASVVSIPDPAAATANFVLAPSALVSGNIVSASGTAGLVVDGLLAANKLLTSDITTPDVGANLIWFSVTCGQAALASAGSVTLYASSGAKQFKVVALYMGTGTNFSGGGGDRLGQVTDATTVYSVIPAATMQTLTNSVWGSTALAAPASASMGTSTAAGASLVFKYSGGTTDYTAGSVTISGLLVRVA